MDTNFIGIAISLVAIAITIFFGLRSLKGEIKNTLADAKRDLSTISERVVIIQETVKNVWDVAKRSPSLIGGGTVVRTLKNLGSVSITAEPHGDGTIYALSMHEPVFDGKRIVKLAKSTGFDISEKELFGGDVSVEINTPIPTRLLIKLPSTEATLCTKYMSFFLKWLDSEYARSLPRIADFEESIEV